MCPSPHCSKRWSRTRLYPAAVKHADPCDKFGNTDLFCKLVKNGNRDHVWNMLFQRYWWDRVSRWFKVWKRYLEQRNQCTINLYSSPRFICSESRNITVMRLWNIWVPNIKISPIGHLPEFQWTMKDAHKQTPCPRKNNLANFTMMNNLARETSTVILCQCDGSAFGHSCALSSH